MSGGCLFCRIAAGDVPAAKVHEDAQCLAFLDLHPIRPGHLLLIPKSHVDHYCDLPDALALHMTTVAQKLARRLRDRLAPERVGHVVAGYGVPHAHLHIIPMHDAHDIFSARYAALVDGAIRFSLDGIPPAAFDEQQAMARRLADA